jgi:hypothetical protein
MLVPRPLTKVPQCIAGSSSACVRRPMHPPRCGAAGKRMLKEQVVCVVDADESVRESLAGMPGMSGEAEAALQDAVNNP